jgi:hypothetical protein
MRLRDTQAHRRERALANLKRSRRRCQPSAPAATQRLPISWLAKQQATESASEPKTTVSRPPTFRFFNGVDRGASSAQVELMLVKQAKSGFERRKWHLDHASRRKRPWRRGRESGLLSCQGCLPCSGAGFSGSCVAHSAGPFSREWAGCCPGWRPRRTSRILRHPWCAPSPCAGPVPPIRLGKPAVGRAVRHCARAVRGTRGQAKGFRVVGSAPSPKPRRSDV